MTETTALRGVGPARARGLERLGVRTVRDLLLLLPRRLERRGPRLELAQAREAIGEQVSSCGQVGGVRWHRSGRGRSLVRARLVEGDQSIDLLFFNQPWQREHLKTLADEGQQIEAYGRVVETRSGPALSAPMIGTQARPLPEPGELSCVYPSTDGIGQAFLRGILQEAVEGHAEALAEPLLGADREGLGLPALADAVRELHRPTSEQDFLAARRRVCLEPLLSLQARLLARRAAGVRGRARAVAVSTREASALFDAFSFEPTGGQRRCLGEILSDLARTVPMRRLLQGDVGSGKTAVGLAAAIAVARSGGQVALLAPTELLAEQHHAGLAAVLERAGVGVELLTGSLGAAQRGAALESLARGRASLAIGTHALLSKKVDFRRLDLAVIDEQQRFGVAQRRALLDKGEDVHALLMTATPIPRTLALTLYGDLAVSLLDERPPGRKPVATHVVGPGDRSKVVRRVKERLADGERAFWVVPRIEADGDEEEDEEESSQAAEQAHARLSSALGVHGVELVHGRLAREERIARVERFRSGASRLLVGTTVVEVGVDVPEATLLVIDGAERFGLAQLHQLRGRVGRSEAQSHCVLIAGGSGAERCHALAASADGFEIAEEDLRRRGMGELAGLRQSGEAGDEFTSDPRLHLFARDAVADERVRDHYLDMQTST